MLTPFVIVGITIAENATASAKRFAPAIEDGPPEPPAWLTGLPLVGEMIAATWSTFAHDTTKLLDLARQYIEPVRKVLLASGTTVLCGILQLALSIFIAFFFFRDGDAVIDRVHAAIERIAGERGHRLAVIATVTVRGVVIGILGTALAQGVLMAIGLWMAGVKAAPLLGLVTFFLSPVPIGPPLVWIPVGALPPQSGRRPDGASSCCVWGLLVVSSVDNFLKPMLISRGSDSAVRARADRRAGRRRRVRIHRRVPRSGPDRRRLRAAEGMGAPGRAARAAANERARPATPNTP